MKCLWDRFFSEQFHPPLGGDGTARSLPKGNALSEIGNHWIFKYVNLVFKGLRKPYTYGKFAAHN